MLYSCTGKEATPEEPAEQEQPQNGMGGLLIFLVVGLLGGGAALYYVKFMKPKQNVKGSTDLDEFDFDESITRSRVIFSSFIAFAPCPQYFLQGVFTP